MYQGNPWEIDFGLSQQWFELKHGDSTVAPCESTGKEVSFQWAPRSILSTDSKVRTTLQDSIAHAEKGFC